MRGFFVCWRYQKNISIVEIISPKNQEHRSAQHCCGFYILSFLFSRLVFIPCVDACCQSPTLQTVSVTSLQWRAHQRISSTTAGIRVKTRPGRKSGRVSARRSSATTLIMNGLEFGGQELSKRPDMIGQSRGHAGGLVAPLELDQS